jgi:hypothetical protein
MLKLAAKGAYLSANPASLPARSAPCIDPGKLSQEHGMQIIFAKIYKNPYFVCLETGLAWH